MTLQFATELNNKPNYFVEKIWRGLVDVLGYSDPNYYFDELQGLGDVISGKMFGKVKPKIHTIREDKTNRWKVGNKIHFKVWKGKAYRSEQIQIVDVLRVKSIQSIEIRWNKYRTIPGLIDVKVYIDDRQLPLFDSQVEQLAINDGFKNAKDFFDYFNKDFTGKIIHWTSFSY